MFLQDSFGWVIYCPLLLKGGRAKPHFSEIKRELSKFNKLSNPFILFLKLISLSPFENKSKNRKRYLKRILEIRPDWGDINQYIRPIDNYEGVTGYRILPTVNISEMSFKEFKDYLKPTNEKCPKVNTGFYNDKDWYPEI